MSKDVQDNGVTEESEVDVLLDTLADVINQACSNPHDSRDPELDSMALSAYADGMRLLAQHGRFQILHEAGRRVIGVWPK